MHTGLYVYMDVDLHVHTTCRLLKVLPESCGAHIRIVAYLCITLSFSFFSSSSYFLQNSSNSVRENLIHSATCTHIGKEGHGGHWYVHIILCICTCTCIYKYMYNVVAANANTSLSHLCRYLCSSCIRLLHDVYLGNVLTRAQLEPPHQWTVLL